MILNPHTESVPEGCGTIFRREQDGKMIMEVFENPSRANVKCLLDLLDGSPPREWQKTSELIPLHEVQVEDLSVIRCPSFRLLPAPIGESLARLWKKGRVLLTFQDGTLSSFSLLADTNRRAPAPGRGGTLLFRGKAVLAKECDREFTSYLKGVGPIDCRPISLLAPLEGRRPIRAVHHGVEQMEWLQYPGMKSASDADLRHLLRTEDYFPHHRRELARPAFHLTFRLPGIRHSFGQLCRLEPTNARLGQFPWDTQWDKIDYASLAAAVGRNAARILCQPIAGIHTVLNLENIMANGWYTDAGSIVDLYEELLPKTTSEIYWQFTLRLISYRYHCFERGDFRQSDWRFLPDFLRGFLEGVGETNPALLPPLEKARTPAELLEKLWKHHLAPAILSNRSALGFDRARAVRRLPARGIETRTDQEIALLSKKEETDLHRTVRRPLTVLVLAAGKGTRFPGTSPKVLRRVGGQPMILRLLDSISKAGLPKPFVVVGYQGGRVVRALGERALPIWQQRPQGTGHAVRVAESVLKPQGGDILIIYGDNPLWQPRSLAHLVASHRVHGSDLTIFTIRPPENVHLSAGRIVRGNDGRVLRIVEERDATAGEQAIQEFNSGLWCIRSEFLWPALQKIKPSNRQGEYYLTDILGIAVEGGCQIRTLLLSDWREAVGVNTPEELRLARRILREWRQGG